MKPPFPKHEVKVRFAALADAPTYTLAEAQAEAERINRETAELNAQTLDPKSVWDKFNKRA